MTEPTCYPDINRLLDTLRDQIKTVLGDKLIGLYLFGSLVYGDFDDDVSDIDVLAAISSDLDAADFDALNAMQTAFVAQHRQWEGRLEIAYVSRHALQTFKTETSKIGIISPGEPFHIVDAGKDWLINWYPVSEIGVTLFGPPPFEIIETISFNEFIQAVRGQMVFWHERVDKLQSQPSQAYAILTLCRALYSVKNNDQTSKLQAALWAAEQMPEWSPLIMSALRWRKAWRNPDSDYESTLPDTRRFVRYMIKQVC